MPADPSRARQFFEAQFERQIRAADYALNPFEEIALPWLKGRVLDLGCGLGNLALAAAANGASVLALDASAAAVSDLDRRARAANLDVTAQAADLRGWRPPHAFDAVACIGLLMFFEERVALAGLRAVRDAVAPGGVASVNVLVQGTTYLEMFDPAGYHLFAHDELAAPFAGWEPLVERTDEFAAPAGTRKRFVTLVRRRP